jgi:hypothetical protein
MHWIKEPYSNILSGLLDQFVSTKRDARAAVVSDAAKQITAIADKEGYDVPDLLEKVS